MEFSTENDGYGNVRISGNHEKDAHHGFGDHMEKEV